MSVRQDILKCLVDSKNLAAERVIESAIAVSSDVEKHQLANVLLERNRRPGWVALIRNFDQLDEQTRNALIARPRDLFGPLSEAMHDSEGRGRENVISIVRKCGISKLVYLLAEALMDARAEVRTLAGESLLDSVRSHRAARDPEKSPDPDEISQIRRAVDFALDKYRTHRQQPALLAALMFERQQDAPMWAHFADPYNDLTRAATVVLRAPADPDLAPGLLLALASPLKPAAMAGLAAVENSAMAVAVARESYRLIDPVLREAAQAIAHLKMLPALRNAFPCDESTWTHWLRLIEAVGLQPSQRLGWLTRIIELAPTQAAAWRICTLKAIADTELPEAAQILVTFLSDPDERVARCAARFLTSKRIPEWRARYDALGSSPYIAIRRMAAQLPRTTAPGSEPTFQKVWTNYESMPPALQHSAARAASTAENFPEQLKQKLDSTLAIDVAQGLKMLLPVRDISPYRPQIITLCGHPDPRIASIAVRLVGRLEDPKLKDLLEAAAHHPDHRVRANAIESMATLHIADKSQQVLAMLNSRHNRERANAIKAISEFNYTTARECLARMLADANPMHRISALWVVGQLQMLELLRHVASMARKDPNLRVRKRASEMVETINPTSIAGAG